MRASMFNAVVYTICALVWSSNTTFGFCNDHPLWLSIMNTALSVTYAALGGYWFYRLGAEMAGADEEETDDDTTIESAKEEG